MVSLENQYTNYVTEIIEKSAEILVRDIITNDTVQLCCSPFVTPFWQKVGFDVAFFDQSLYMHRMVLKKEKSKKEE